MLSQACQQPEKIDNTASSPWALTAFGQAEYEQLENSAGPFSKAVSLQSVELLLPTFAASLCSCWHDCSLCQQAGGHKGTSQDVTAEQQRSGFCLGVSKNDYRRAAQEIPNTGMKPFDNQDCGSVRSSHCASRVLSQLSQQNCE